jgi:anti-anti-sigma factor
MRKRGSKLSVSRTGTVTQVTFPDASICDDAHVEQMRCELFELIDAVNQPKLLLSFEHVTELSSAALGVLIRIHQRISEIDGQLRLASVKPPIHEVFTMTNLHGVFRICADAQEALDSFE